MTAPNVTAPAEGPLDVRVRLTHNYVLAEFIALAHARKMPRLPALRFVADVQNNAAIQMIFASEQLHRSALALLEQRPDKSWSLCDAVSFLLMRQEGVQEALTIDYHFEQAGSCACLSHSGRTCRADRRPPATRLDERPKATARRSVPATLNVVSTRGGKRT